MLSISLLLNSLNRLVHVTMGHLWSPQPVYVTLFFFLSLFRCASPPSYDEWPAGWLLPRNNHKTVFRIWPYFVVTDYISVSTRFLFFFFILYCQLELMLFELLPDCVHASLLANLWEAVKQSGPRGSRKVEQTKRMNEWNRRKSVE